MVEDGAQDGGYRTAADCISAGMYWFSQSDLTAAEAWWRRALELEPGNPRAQACLRLLHRTSSTGFKSDSWARLPASRPANPVEATTDVFSDPARSSAASRAPVPSVGAPRAAGASTGSLDLDSADLDAESIDLDSGRSAAPSSLGPGSGVTGIGRFLEELERSREIEGPTQDVAAEAGRGALSSAEGAEPAVRSPWDEGPSRTSVITVPSSGEFDAVADPTPLPELDRERFFNRGDPSSRDEIVEFLHATGDLPQSAEDDLASVAEASTKSSGTTGLSEDLAGMSIQDGVSTEPSTKIERASPSTALQRARDSYQLHDFQGVLDALESYPAEAEAQTEVRNMIAESRANLLRMYEAKIGDLDQIPSVKVSSEEVIWLNLNHRAGFILSQVDGTVSYEDLVSLSGMPRLDTVRILTELLDQNVIGT